MAAAMIACLMASSSALGQIVYGRPTSGEVAVVYSHWELDGDSGMSEIDQFTMPLVGFVPIRDNWEAYVFVNSSTNSLTSAGTDSDLSGLGDVRVQVNRSLREDRILLSVGINLPIGKKKLTQDEERPVLQWLSQNYLSFPMRRFGEGFGFNVLLGAAEQMGDVRFGGGVMYQFTGSYDPYEGSADYNPGDFISINGGADWKTDEWMLSGGAVLTHFFEDQSNGVDVFRQSTQFDVRLGADYDTERYGISISLGYLARGRNTFYAPDPDITERVFGDEFSINGSLTRRFQDGWYVGPAAQLRLIGDSERSLQSDEGLGSSQIIGLGADVGKALSEQVSAGLGGRYFTGSADDSDIDVSGFQVTAALRVSL